MSTASQKPSKVPQFREFALTGAIERPGLEPARATGFRSALALSVARTRWLRPYATPCQSRGTTF